MTWGGLLKNAGLAALITIVVNALLALAARPLLDIPAEFEPVGPVASTIATSMYMVMGTIAVLIVARFAKHPVRVFWIVSVLGLALSFGPNVNLAMNPTSMPGATTAAMVFLAVQHFVGFAIFVPWLTRTLGRAKR